MNKGIYSETPQNGIPSFMEHPFQNGDEAHGWTAFSRAWRG